MNDELLIRLFERHFVDPVAAVRRLESHLADVQLPFDLKLQLRELVFPAQPGLPNGLPSVIYYYVPDSRRGTDQPTPQDPLHPSFLNVCDGIGLNLGCPVRLLRALEALVRLAPGDQQGPRAGLRNSHEHLSTIEELLWLTGWKSSSGLRRGGQFDGVAGDVDWAFEVAGSPIYLEAKFRRSDWPRLAERGSFVRMGEGFLSSATHKFPDPPQEPAVHIVGVTTFDNVTEGIIHDIGRELEAAPQIHAVVMRSLIQMTHILSLSVEIRDRVLAFLAVPLIRDFPMNHGVFYHREQRDRRIAGRASQNSAGSASRVVCWSLQPQGTLPRPMPEPGLYRLNIPSRGADGEPHFQVVPKYLMSSENQP
ncbi:MAG TPA: hypothetical protein VNU68_30525 [Verrucomicrobiae bacterium]|nr:hypothetical protein [Verrucomicrobiae bacterium]